MVKTTSQHSLQLGTSVFYPAHGVATVVGVEERDFGDSYQQFFALELEGGDKVLLPIGNVAKARVRDLVSPDRARKMLQRVLAEPSAANGASRRQRVAEYKECLRSGAADDYTGVLQDLLFRARAKSLASDEKRVLAEARSYFVAEVSAVLGVPRSDILNKMC